MAIAASDIKIYRGAKRDQTDTAGGVPSGVVVVDGMVNNLFQNISRLDRVRGEITLEKVFVGVASANTDTFKGSFMAVCDPPFDENVNVMLIKSPSYASERAAVVDQLESFYDLGPEAGNAKPAYAYLPGAEKILYLLRWYEYTPRYAPDGSMIMTTKYDLKATMNISVGDILWFGDESKDNGEYIEVAGVKTLYEEMPDPDANHYYNKIYLEVNLASPLENIHYTNDITRRTARNSAWEIFGCMRLKTPLFPGDAYASVKDIAGRLIPVIEKNKLVTGQVVNQPAVLKNDVSIEAGGITIDMAQVKQNQLSEKVDISGTSVSHVFAYGPVDVSSVVFRYRHQKRWIVSESSAEGLLAGDVTGAVVSSGKAMSLNLSLAPDPGTVGIVTYLTQHQYEVCQSDNLIAGAGAEAGTETRNILGPLNGYIVNLAYPSSGTLKPGSTRIYALIDGEFQLIGQDDMFGIIGGSVRGRVDTKTEYKRVEITDNFTGVNPSTLKFEFVVQGGEDYVISVPLPIDFRREKLVPGGITGVIVSPLGALDFYDNKLGVLRLRQSAFGGVAVTEATNGLPAGYVYLKDICVANKSIMAIVKKSSGRSIVVLSGDNGRSWQVLASVGEYIGLVPRCAYGINNGAAFYAYAAMASVTSTYPRIYYSTNGSTWSYRSSPYYGGSQFNISAVCFGNNQIVFAQNVSSSEMSIFVEGNGFSSFGSEVVTGILKSDFGELKQIKFGTDGEGNPRFVGVFSLGKTVYGNGSMVATDWIFGLLPWADDVLWLEFAAATNTWVCVGSSRHIAYSVDGAEWNNVSPAFLEVDDSGLCGLSVSDDGMFVISASNGRYSSMDGKKWTVQALHPAITSSDQYLIVFNDGVWVELYRDSSTELVSVISHNQQEAIPIVDIGMVDYSSGKGEVTAIDGILSVSSDMYLAERVTKSFAVHTNGAAPVTPGTFRLECKALTSDALVCTGDDSTGLLSGDAEGVYNAEHGFAYGTWREPFFPETLLMESGYRSIYHPEFDGLNEKAFPLDGRVPLIKKDALAMITDKGSYRLAVSMDADDLQISLEDADGWPPVMPDPCLVEIGSEKIRIQNRDGNALTVAERAYGGTVAAQHMNGSTVFLTTFNMELNPVASVQAGTIEFANDMAHAYSAGAVVAAVIESGDLQAILQEYHTQESWDGWTWSDSVNYGGSPAGGVYNFPDYPMVLTNIGCVTERWLIEITSTNPLTGQVRGENLGVVASGVSLASNVAPINPNVNAPYFFMNAQGFSGGWQVGNILRFNTRGALAPAWVARVVEAKASTATDDGAEIWVGGDVPVA